MRPWRRQAESTEDRSYDANVTASDVDHRRPDIVCVWGGVRYIIDVTIAWSTDTGGVLWRDVGYDADRRAAMKDEAYAKSLAREREGGVGRLVPNGTKVGQVGTKRAQGILYNPLVPKNSFLVFHGYVS